MSDRLTADELAELVGCKPNQRVRMAEWLRTRSWIHEIDMNGLPVVMRAYRDRKLGIVDGKVTATHASTPDFSHFR
jgi:hypothetical protein